jgi:hypothetical protein
MTNLSDLFPAGAGKQVSFVADGSISAAGKPVILNGAGTVTPVGLVTGSETLGGPVAANDVLTKGYGVDICYDVANDKLVAIWYRNSDKYPMVAVGTVSGTTTTWGTPVVVESVAADGQPVIEYSPDDEKVLAVYTGPSPYYLRGIVGTVSGTTTTWGSSTNIVSVNSQYPEITYDTGNNQFLIQLFAGVSPYDCTVNIGIISGTSVSFTGSTVFATGSGNIAPMGIAYDENAVAFAILYKDGSHNLYGRTGTSDGSAITFGTATQIGTWNSYGVGDITYDSTAQKCVGVWKNTSGYGAGAVLTVVGGTTRSFTDATETAFNSANIGTGNLSLAGTYAGTNANITTIVFIETSDNYPRFCNGTVTGTAISFNAAARLWSDNGQNSRNNICVIKDGKVAIIANPNTTIGSLIDNYTYVNILQNVADVTNLTSTNVLGISDAAISDTASGNITVKGGIAVNGLSSLTPGTDYYVQSDGSISTVTTSPAVKLGRALSATSIDLEYQS